MAELTIRRGSAQTIQAFEAPQKLSAVLTAAGFSVQQPCGGRGACGKCAVTLSGAVSAPNAAEVRAGCRLACQAVLTGDAAVTLPEAREMEQIESDGAAVTAALSPMEGTFGAAADIDTTTVVLKVYELATGRCLGEAGMRNPQTAAAADVMGRIGAALKGEGPALRRMIRGALDELLAGACRDAGIAPAQVDAAVVTGNTTMLQEHPARGTRCQRYLSHQLRPARHQDSGRTRHDVRHRCR